MTLDPDVKKFLELMKSLNIPKFSMIGAEGVRKLMNSGSLPVENIEIKEVEDLEMKVDRRIIKARMYTPELLSDGLILFFHGGGFVFGNLDSYDSICRRAALDSGCKVISVDYSLAPENKFPSAVEDAYSSYLWVVENAGRLGVNNKRIALAGDSAGGNISATASLMIRDRKKDPPRLQVLLYPSLGRDFSSESMREFSEDYFLTGEQINWFGNMYLNSLEDTFNPYFSPFSSSSLSGLPEALIVTAEYDPLRDQGESYAAMLRSSGVHTTAIRGLGMIHGFLSFSALVPSSHSLARMIWSLVGKMVSED
jgi:acetyl esterase